MTMLFPQFFKNFLITTKELKKQEETLHIKENLQLFSPAHLFAHSLGVECDHLSSLLKLVTQKYLSLRLKTYGKRFSQMVVHKNQPSLRLELTKTILLRNQ